MVSEDLIQGLVEKYVRDNDVIAAGTGRHGETFLKKLALYTEEQGFNVRVIPTSIKHAGIAASLGLKLASMNGKEVDLAFEFVDMVDKDYNYIKRDSSSLVRDKMIAQSAAVLIAIAREQDMVPRLKGRIPFEVSPFGHGRTLLQLDSLGKAMLRSSGSAPYKTETNHFLIDVDVDAGYSLEDLEYKARGIPGVVETGLFLGYADKVVLHDRGVRVESITDYR